MQKRIKFRYKFYIVKIKMKIAKQFIARMNYNTFVRLKASFPAKRNESMASYFNRLAVYLNELGYERRKK